MEWMSVRDASRIWEVSERLVQKWCSDGAISGARKFGKSWMMPASSRKPSRGAAASAPADGTLAPMPLMSSSFVPGHAIDLVESVGDARLRDIARAEYHYFRGEPEEAVERAEPYITSRDLALAQSACLIFAYASFSLGRIRRARAALGLLEEHARSQEGEPASPSSAFARLSALAAKVLLHIPIQEPFDFRRCLGALPFGLRQFGVYVGAHAAYLRGEYGLCVGLAEGALAMAEGHVVPMTYLHLVAAMGHMAQRDRDSACGHVLAAWELSRHDGLIEPFAEHHGLLGGVLESTIKPEWPAEFGRIISVTYRFSEGWRSIHNPATGEDVAGNLTTTEFAVAMLAARGWTNREISEHLKVSVNTVKTLMSSVMRKLGPVGREDLARRLLR